jgi:hypothetical protein
MNKKRKYYLFVLFFGAIFLMGAGFVHGLEANYSPIFGISMADDSLPEFVKYFFNIGVFIAVLLAAGTIAFGGVYYLISLGKGKFTDEGKSWIKSGSIGLALTVSAYLIAYTINPGLVILDLKGLTPLNYLSHIFNPNPYSPPIETFNEIPIGVLTENLLAKEIDCYDFDGNGNPIDAKIQIGNNRTINGPTYLKHDLVDCVLKLGQAAEKKAKKTKALSDELLRLMNQCSCGSGSFTFTGSESTTQDTGSTTTSEAVCTNKTCSTKIDDKTGQSADCKFPGAPTCPTTYSKTTLKGCIGSSKLCQDSCSNKGCQGTGNCCPEGVKEKIDHGPIKLNSTDSECSSLKEYKGMDEFKSEYGNSYDAIKNAVELKMTVDDKEITIIKNGNCQVCEDNSNLSKCLQEREKCFKDNSAWYKLRLVDQLTYFKGKIDELKEKLQKDLESLKTAESSLGQCYMADSYIDFLQTYEKNNKENKTIMINRSFSDSDGNKITPAKYCQGYQYNNSSCYSQCQKICPGTAEADIGCYKRAQNAEQAKNCFDNRVCTPGASPFGTFQQCFSACKQDCKSSCTSLCGKDKDACIKKCENNSKCITENADKCLVDFNQAMDCAKNTSDEGTLKNCMQKAATLCPYCTDQYAGYAECLKNPYSTQDKYSSSFIYQNQGYQVCNKPYEPITIRSGNNVTVTNCLTLYPETAKCPAASKCPQCPCDFNEDTTNYETKPTVPPPPPADTCAAGGTSSGGTSSGGTSTCQTTNPSAPGYCAGGSKCVSGVCTTTSTNPTPTNKKEYRVCSGECDADAYNDDPLTFYCQQAWWLKKEETKNTVPIGQERVCPKEREIPVGQTIDNAQKWAQIFKESAEKLSKKIGEMTDYMAEIGREQNYCKCDSKCDAAGKEPTCQAKCAFQFIDATTKTETNSDGSTSTIDVPAQCRCARQGCSGNPCQKIINLLQGKSAGTDCPKNVEYKGIAYFAWQINNAVQDYIISDMISLRSETLKQLSYSREKTNECSVVQNNYGAQTRMLSCTRVEHEIISPINDPNNKVIVGGKVLSSYCYGKELGSILNAQDPMADNWFCCEDRKKEEQ